MVATSRLRMSDLSRQLRLETDLSSELTPQHTVGQAVDHFRARSRLPDHGTAWTAVSRGVRLDANARLADVPEVDSQWTVMPQVSAG